MCLGDYDHDGLPDILLVSRTACPASTRTSGEASSRTCSRARAPSATSPSRAESAVRRSTSTTTAGRTSSSPTATGWPRRLFFNRGFRCFGLSRKMDAQMQGLLPQAAEGQQAGCVADFTGHNAMDMFLVLNNGEMWLLPRKVDGTALAVIATLSTNSPSAGPVSVTAFDQNKRSLRSVDGLRRRTGRFPGHERDGAAYAQVAVAGRTGAREGSHRRRLGPPRATRQEIAIG